MRRLAGLLAAIALLLVPAPVRAQEEAPAPTTTLPGETTPPATQTTPPATQTTPPATQTTPPATQTTPPAQSTPPAPVTTLPGDPAAEAERDDLAATDLLVLVAILLCLVALAALLVALARALAWEPAWLPRARHAVAEAGWRTSGAWADFGDWLRLRR